MIPIYQMPNGVEYVLESDMSIEVLTPFKEYQILAQCPVPETLKDGDYAHYAHDWQRWLAQRK